jgi:acetylornithine/succinyldiaminopimelate/putrescine aminotransferase
MKNARLSLADLVGGPYVDAVCDAKAFIQELDREGLRAIGYQKVDLVPDWYRQRLDDLVEMIGERVASGLPQSAPGAGTASFTLATTSKVAPLTGLGFVRIGEDGRAYLVSKSEHYHASLGHGFPGYKLIDNARAVGIPNATHNSTRGHITRLLEQELVRVANGIPRGEPERLRQVIDSSEPHVLNRVLNLETGSLVVEAALKMLLARFYRLEETFPEPEYLGRTPVFLVIADRAGGTKANYHGTTILTQVMRGMWSELAQMLERSGAFVVRPVRINDLDDFQRTLRSFERPPYKVAGFFHEIVLMNYGAILLEKDYLQQAYALCRDHDVPTVVDEIQSCIWSPEYFLFREYGLQPDLVSVGKGFPGGEFAASRVLATAALDSLNQFGAIVTNGQEELASISYLVTMAFVEANGPYIKAVGDYYAQELRALAGRHPDLIESIEGFRHLSAVFFHSVEQAVDFVRQLTEAGIDISAQTYKADCPPAALTKLPLVSTYRMVDFLIGKMDEALRRL